MDGCSGESHLVFTPVASMVHLKLPELITNSSGFNFKTMQKTLFIILINLLSGSGSFAQGIEVPRGKPRGTFSSTKSIFDPIIIPKVLANPAASSGECASGIQYTCNKIAESKSLSP